MAFSETAKITAVVTAGGRLPIDMAARAATTIKALAPVGGMPLILRILSALEAAGVASPVLVGPIHVLRSVVANDEIRFVAEGATGPENIGRALATLTPDEKSRPILLCTSDLPFVTGKAIAQLLETAPPDADIVFPVVTKESFLAAFPGSPNTYARLAGQEYTGGSVLLVRPEAIERNLPLIQRVFDARKSQIGMAKMLGPWFLFRFLTGTLTVAQAERRASELTGCRCRALVGAPPELCADIDSLADYEWAESFIKDKPDVKTATSDPSVGLLVR